jgi:hypothetical protein
VIEDGKNGWVLSEVTPDRIAGIIRRCFKNGKRLNEFSTNSVPAESFNLDQIGNQWLNTLN